MYAGLCVKIDNLFSVNAALSGLSVFKCEFLPPAAQNINKFTIEFMKFHFHVATQ